jgi:hypothetical protein
MANLGFAAKVSTIRPQPGLKWFDENKVWFISELTYTVLQQMWDTFPDNMSFVSMNCINEHLILGFTQKLSYKTDADTISGKYVVRRHPNI